MPNRILRPWTDSEAVNLLSDGAEVFFVRLIMCADDLGRFYGSPRLLKSYLFPLKDKTDKKISRFIRECVKAGLVLEYESAGKKYLFIRNFGQRMRVMKSKFPTPPQQEGHFSDRLRAARVGIGLDFQKNDGHMTVKCQSNDGQMSVTRRETRDEKYTHLRVCDNAPAHTREDFLPHSVEEVMELAKNPFCGMPCNREQADAYFTDRLARDWIPHGQQRQLRTQVQVCADLKKWLMRDLNEKRERKAKDGNKHFCNESAQYDSADDGSNF